MEMIFVSVGQAGANVDELLAIPKRQHLPPEQRM
jgi:hypothetical protein